jgi:S1-C subfamily serine protease
MSQNSAVKKSLTYLSLVLMGAAGSLLGTQLLPNRPELVPPSVAQIPAPIPNSGNANFIANAVDRTGAAVVRIDAAQAARRTRQPGSRVVRGTGSGFIIKPDGLILTNAHVIGGADTVNVTLKDGRRFTGRVLGRDELTDVAVVRIQANNLPAVTIGNSDRLRPGEWAIAIGNPLGLDNTVTAGIISATGRSSSDVGIPDRRIGFIQTDAAINPGNSGGPLLNQQGQVVGMNTAIIGGAQGLGFAIPIHRAQQIAEQLVAKGRIDRAYLGIRMATLTDEIRETLARESNGNVTISANQGVVIVGVERNSPAAAAGIRPGDVIQQINGQQVRSADDVQQAVENSQIGMTLPVEISRNGRNIKLSVRAGEFPTSAS